MAHRVLLAEDEPNIVESLVFLLNRAGFEVDVQSDGKRALETALAERPDVMVLDVMLPRIDGFEILRSLRADKDGRNLPIIMLTAKGQREDRETALRYGADLFITKPFANADVIKAIQDLVQGRPLGAVPGDVVPGDVVPGGAVSGSGEETAGDA